MIYQLKSVCLGFRKWAIQRYILFSRVISIFVVSTVLIHYPPFLKKTFYLVKRLIKMLKSIFLKFGFEYLVIFLYVANICLGQVVDSKILCLFTLVFKACNVCNFKKMIVLLLKFLYHYNFIFHDLLKTNVRYFSIH